VLDHAVVSPWVATGLVQKILYLRGSGGSGGLRYNQPITALHALTVAGGHNRDNADLTSVILISKDIYGKPIGRRLDLKRILDVGDMGSAIMVKPYDVIYVPRTYIGDVNLFIDQYLGAITNFKAFVDLWRR